MSAPYDQTKCLDLDLPNKVLNAAIATGAGSTYAVPKKRGLGGSPVIVSWSTAITGSPTSVSVTLQASNDGTIWSTLDTSTSTSGELRTFTQAAATYLRANLGTLSGGTNPTVSVFVQLGG